MDVTNSRIAYQSNGRSEEFSSGTLAGSSWAKPRWFQFGKVLTHGVDTQKAIVAQLIGETNGLAKDVALHRKMNYLGFFRGMKSGGDFWTIDVPC